MPLYEMKMRHILTLYTNMLGWTLQELLAPSKVEFYDQDWTFRGSRKDHTDTISEFTSIPAEVLLRPKRIYKESVGARMSWASKRVTKRTEDMAYCLLGIFEINMPLIYGEGKRAFLRLQEEIIKRNNDLTIFAWETVLVQPYKTGDSLTEVLATSPAAFAGSADLRNISVEPGPEFSITNRGLLLTGDFKLSYRSYSLEPKLSTYMLQVATTARSAPLNVALRKLAPRLYGRLRKTPKPRSLHSAININDTPIYEDTIYIKTDLHHHHIDIAHLSMSRKNALHIHEQEDLKIYRGIPETLWDHSDAVFLQPRQDFAYPYYSSVVAVKFNLLLGGHSHNIYVVYESGVLHPVLHVFSSLPTLEQRRDIMRLFPTFSSEENSHHGNQYRDLVSKKDISWEDVRREAPWLLKEGDSTNVHGTAYRYNIKFFLESGRLDPHRIPVISLKASVIKGEPLDS
jgi:hypothetical protein